MDPGKIISRFLEDSDRSGSVIPHTCQNCGVQLWTGMGDKNYIYHEGYYYCKDCFSNRSVKKLKYSSWDKRYKGN